jgi:hypothetical protein
MSSSHLQHPQNLILSPRARVSATTTRNKPLARLQDSMRDAHAPAYCLPLRMWNWKMILRSLHRSPTTPLQLSLRLSRSQQAAPQPPHLQKFCMRAPVLCHPRLLQVVKPLPRRQQVNLTQTMLSTRTQPPLNKRDTADTANATYVTPAKCKHHTNGDQSDNKPLKGVAQFL